jgi:hypothetical protein
MIFGSLRSITIIYDYSDFFGSVRSITMIYVYNDFWQSAFDYNDIWVQWFLVVYVWCEKCTVTNSPKDCLHTACDNSSELHCVDGLCTCTVANNMRE